ncbi:hypothetical protein ACS0TY_025324 [Phlomoides rotata]
MSNLNAEETQALNQCHNLIERCLQLYMKPSEIINKLYHHANIMPALTEAVLHRLQEENPEFFAAYNTWLIMRDQIQRFNQLLERLVELRRPTQIIQNRFFRTNVVGEASAPPFSGGVVAPDISRSATTSGVFSYGAFDSDKVGRPWQ